MVTITLLKVALTKAMPLGSLTCFFFFRLLAAEVTCFFAI
jgi:hypothetical protein